MHREMFDELLVRLKVLSFPVGVIRPCFLQSRLERQMKLKTIVLLQPEDREEVTLSWAELHRLLQDPCHPAAAPDCQMRVPMMVRRQVTLDGHLFSLYFRLLMRICILPVSTYVCASFQHIFVDIPYMCIRLVRQMGTYIHQTHVNV